MVVQRVWKVNGVHPRNLVDVDSRRLAFPAPSPFIELLAVLVRPPMRVVVFGVDTTVRDALPEGPRRRGPAVESSEEAPLLRSSGSLPDDLTELLDRVCAIVPDSVSHASSIADLVILLRTLEEQTPGTTQVHVIAESLPGAGQERLGRWLGWHPRFSLHRVAEDRTWTATARSFLDQWAPGSLHRRSFQAVSRFTLATVQRVGTGSEVPPGFVWSWTG